MKYCSRLKDCRLVTGHTSAASSILPIVAIEGLHSPSPGLAEEPGYSLSLREKVLAIYRGRLDGETIREITQLLIKAVLIRKLVFKSLDALSRHQSVDVFVKILAVLLIIEGQVAYVVPLRSQPIGK